MNNLDIFPRLIISTCWLYISIVFHIIFTEKIYLAPRYSFWLMCHTFGIFSLSLTSTLLELDNIILWSNYTPIYVPISYRIIQQWMPGLVHQEIVKYIRLSYISSFMFITLVTMSLVGLTRIYPQYFNINIFCKYSLSIKIQKILRIVCYIVMGIIICPVCIYYYVNNPIASNHLIYNIPLLKQFNRTQVYVIHAIILFSMMVGNIHRLISVMSTTTNNKMYVLTYISSVLVLWYIILEQYS